GVRPRRLRSRSLHRLRLRLGARSDGDASLSRRRHQAVLRRRRPLRETIQMKISRRWLADLVETPLSGVELAKLLTMAGLEVEAVTPLGNFSGVVAAEVRGKRPHPQAAKLTLVDVFDGREVTQVVCGAPNVPEPGARVLWARPGAKLPGGITLAPKEVRG